MKSTRDLRVFILPILLAVFAMGLIYHFALRSTEGQSVVVYQWLLHEWLTRSTEGAALLRWGPVAVIILSMVGVLALILRPWEHGNHR